MGTAGTAAAGLGGAGLRVAIAVSRFNEKFCERLLAGAKAELARLGVAEGDPDAFFARVTGRRIKLRGIDPREIDALVVARTDARNSRDFARADQIRADLTARGIELRDGASATTWRAV